MKSQKKDEIIDMEMDENGTYHPITPYKRPKFEVQYNEIKVPPVYQFFEGFVIGLEAIERFLRVSQRITKDWFK